jgi:phosphatidylserine/phosphatidylglycerophosphate/cardiolipin synthase-like enzyme
MILRARSAAKSSFQMTISTGKVSTGKVCPYGARIAYRIALLGETHVGKLPATFGRNMRTKQQHVSRLSILLSLNWGELWQRGWWLIPVFGVGLWAIARCQFGPIVITKLRPLPQHPYIRAYFNHNPVATYTDPYRNQSHLGDNLEQQIVEQIQSARSTVEVAVQELRSPLIAQALRRAHQQGVKVRVVLEQTYSRAIYDYSPEQVAALDPHLKQRYQDNLQLIDRNHDQRISATEANDFDAVYILKRANIPFIDDTADGSEGSGLVHHKFVVIDGQRLVVTSANFTLSDLHGDLQNPKSTGNSNSLLVIESQTIAAAFQTEFNLLWGDGPAQTPNSQFGVNKPHRAAKIFSVGDAQVWVKFSPDRAGVPWEETTNGLIARFLTQGQTQINLALFVFSDQGLVNALAPRHQAGVDIRVLVDPSFAYRPYSEALDMLGITLAGTRAESSEDPGEVASALTSTHPCQPEPQNQPWAPPLKTVGTPTLNSGDLLHHKFGVIDQNTVIMGSHNWSAAANTLNDETLLVIQHPTVAAHYQREFEGLYTNGRLGLPERVQAQAQEYQRQCATWKPASTPAPSSAPIPASTTIPVNTPSPSSEPLPSRTPTLTPGQRVNLNTASQAEIEALPGIGPALAERIIEARTKQPLRSLQDLDEIPGVGPQLLKRLESLVSFGS